MNSKIAGLMFFFLLVPAISVLSQVFESTASDPNDFEAFDGSLSASDVFVEVRNAGRFESERGLMSVFVKTTGFSNSDFDVRLEVNGKIASGVVTKGTVLNQGRLFETVPFDISENSPSVVLVVRITDRSSNQVVSNQQHTVIVAGAKESPNDFHAFLPPESPQDDPLKNLGDSLSRFVAGAAQTWDQWTVWLKPKPRFSEIKLLSIEGDPVTELDPSSFVSSDMYLDLRLDVKTANLDPDKDYFLSVTVNGTPLAKETQPGIVLNKGDILWFSPLFQAVQPKANKYSIEISLTAEENGQMQNVAFGIIEVPNAFVGPPLPEPDVLTVSPFVIEVNPDSGEVSDDTLDFLFPTFDPFGKILDSPVYATATACPSPASQASAGVCTRISENVREKISDKTREIKNVFSSPQFKKILDVYRQSLKNGETAPQDVKIELVNPVENRRATGVIRLVPMNDSFVIAPSFPKLSIGIYSLKTGSPRLLSRNTVIDLGLNLGQAPPVYSVQPDDFPLVLGYSWSGLGNDWFKPGDFYPRIFVNPTTNKEPVFDGLLVQEPDVISKVVSQQGDFFFDLDPKSSRDSTLEYLSSFGNPEKLLERPAPLQDPRRFTLTGWAGKTNPFVISSCDIDMVVEIRSAMTNQTMALGSVRYRLPDPLQASPPVVLTDKASEAVEPVEWKIPESWKEFFKKNKNAVVSYCSSAADVTAGRCVEISTELGTVTKDGQEYLLLGKDGLQRFLEKAKTLWTAQSGSEIKVQIGATRPDGSTVTLDSFLVSTVPDNLRESLARLGKKIADELNAMAVELPKPVDSAPPLTPATIKVFFQDGCSDCDDLKRGLLALGLVEGKDFVVFDIGIDPDAKKEIAARLNKDPAEAILVPQSLVGDGLFTGGDQASAINQAFQAAKNSVSSSPLAS